MKTNLNLNQIQLIIFDLDGLLVDTEKTYSEGWRYALDKNHIAVPDDVINSWAGMSFQQTGAYLMKRCGSERIYKQIRKAREEYIYQSLYNDRIMVKPYAKELLVYAKKNGYTIGLASSTKSKRAKAILEYHHIIEYFDFMVFGDDTKRLKPYPDPYLEVLKNANVMPSQAVALEDSMTGIQSADAAGIAVVWVPDQSMPTDIRYTPDNVFLVSHNLLAVKHILQAVRE